MHLTTDMTARKAEKPNALGFPNKLVDEGLTRFRLSALSNLSCIMAPSYIFALLALFSAIAVGDESDPQFLARIQYFQVQKSSAYTCSDPGARCEFRLSLIHI